VGGLDTFEGDKCKKVGRLQRLPVASAVYIFLFWFSFSCFFFCFITFGAASLLGKVLCRLASVCHGVCVCVCVCPLSHECMRIALFSATKVMRCIPCSLVEFCFLFACLL